MKKKRFLRDPSREVKFELFVVIIICMCLFKKDDKGLSGKVSTE